MFSRKWRVDAPGERALRYLTIERAAPRIAKWAEDHAGSPVSVQQVGGWALFYVTQDAEGAVRIEGDYTHAQQKAAADAVAARIDRRAAA